jgi:hypothetical protein
MDSEQIRYANRAEATGYLPHIRQIIRSATAPIWWSRSTSEIGRAILHNGTFCAVDTGKRVVGITAAHVFEQYLSHRKRFDDIECQIGSVRIDLEDYLIESNSTVDLATFDISPILLTATGISIHAPPSWPPKILNKSEIVVLGGCPGMLRQEKPGVAEFPFVSFIARAAQSSDDHVAVQLALNNSHWPDGSGGIPEGAELGGMSGGPLFRYRSEPVEYFELAGFIYEASSIFELVFARHASCIDSSGCIIGRA